MRTFVRADEHGQIVEDIVWFGDSPGPGWVEITDPASRIRLKMDPAKILLENDRVVRRPEIRLVASKTRFTADGQDLVTVELHDVPEGLEEVHVLVGSLALEVPRGEPIEITTQTPGVVTVRVDEPRIYARWLGLIAEAPV